MQREVQKTGSELSRQTHAEMFRPSQTNAYRCRAAQTGAHRCSAEETGADDCRQTDADRGTEQRTQNCGAAEETKGKKVTRSDPREARRRVGGRHDDGSPKCGRGCEEAHTNASRIDQWLEKAREHQGARPHSPCYCCCCYYCCYPLHTPSSSTCAGADDRPPPPQMLPPTMTMQPH